MGTEPWVGGMNGPGGMKPNDCCCKGGGINGGVAIGIGIPMFNGIVLALLLTSLDETCSGVLFLIPPIGVFELLVLLLESIDGTSLV